MVTTRRDVTVKLARRMTLAATLVTIFAGVVGCGGAESAPTTVATEFADAVAADNGALACRLLAPATKSQLEASAGEPCAAAIIEEDLPTAGTRADTATFGTMAKVRLDRDTLFLSAFPDGWRVMAAGCAPVPGHPYDCQLQGS
jgi:hypothetical protein